MNLQVLHITSVIDGRTNSGTARVAREIILELEERDEVKQTLLHFDESSDPIYNMPGIQEIQLNPRGKSYSSRFRAFLFFAVVKRYKFWRKQFVPYDVIHWHVGRIYPFFYILPARKHVLTLHDAGGYLLPNVNTFSTLIFRKVVEWSRKKFDCIIVVSEDAKRRLIGTGRFANSRIEVLYPGSNFHKVQTDFYDLEARGLKKDFILCVSRWQPHKNVEAAIRGFIEFKRLFLQDVALVLVGKPVNNYWQPQVIIDSSEFQEDIYVFNNLNDGNLSYLYKEALLSIFPSLHEGFGLAVLESMSVGCPVIVDCGGATEEVLGLGGVAVDVNNPLAIAHGMDLILKNRVEFVNKALIRSKQFSWRASCDQLLTLYKR